MGSRLITGRRAWETLVAVVATGAALYVPLVLALHVPDGPALVAVESLVTAVFLADIVVRRRQASAARAAGGHATEPPERFPRVALLADVLAALPLSLALGRTPLLLIRLLKLNRVAWAMRVWRHRDVKRSSVLRLVFFLYWLVLGTHALTAGWIAMRGPEEPGAWAAYVAGLYWAVITLATLGYGDITPDGTAQRLYAVLVAVLGVGVYSYVIGNIATILANRDPAKADYLRRLEQLGAFMHYREIPPDLQERIVRYHRYLWQQGLLHDESDLLGHLPPSLRTEVSLFLKRDLIEAVPLFQGADEELLREIALELEPVVFMPGDEIIREGERSREMYFISRGTVEVLGPEGDEVKARLTRGDFFGEMALLFDRARSATVRAVEYCDLYRLRRELFERVLSHYPEVAEKIHERARGRLEAP
ncbi:MAG: cyclic nucleotide-binding domain-containing protein [Actinobacteria bacterium]|nr:cyclic nucleotide-binding domain-containing protein [Actinomycetota bacterium]